MVQQAIHSIQFSLHELGVSMEEVSDILDLLVDITTHMFQNMSCLNREIPDTEKIMLEDLAEEIFNSLFLCPLSDTLSPLTNLGLKKKYSI